MRFALVVLGACGGVPAPTIDNRAAPAARCELPSRFDFEARRYASLDADHPDYQTWSAWRVGIQIIDRQRDQVRATLAMVGDELVWSFEVKGTLDPARCRLELFTDTHEVIVTTLDLRARTGRISSIDDEWLLGPPFPAKRP
jgi:hypothetical protein